MRKVWERRAYNTNQAALDSFLLESVLLETSY
jgi:hypothetical protein